MGLFERSTKPMISNQYFSEFLHSDLKERKMKKKHETPLKQTGQPSFLQERTKLPKTKDRKKATSHGCPPTTENHTNCNRLNLRLLELIQLSEVVLILQELDLSIGNNIYEGHREFLAILFYDKRP